MQELTRCVAFNGRLVVNALIDMYVKCGIIPKAQEIFNKMLDVDIVS